MGIKAYKPTTSGIRWQKISDFKELSKNASPEKRLMVSLKKSGGRNSQGRITSRHRGGRHKRKLRIIDFAREKRNVPGRVVDIQYDPNRTGRIALIEFSDGEKRYIISPLGLKVNDSVIAAPSAEIKIGNAMQLRHIPAGIPICNVELKIGKGGQIARSAGNLCTIMAKEGKYAHVRLPSGEVRLISLDCYATIGQISNVDHEAISLGKAGKSRYLGRRPYSRGVVKNPHDHPMGGGEGKSSGGRHPTTPWGKITKGLKTRKSKSSDRYIIKRRK
ncbi:MAG: 50S ribosomal protein L2 [Candidatus Omnitrophica bacterium]|nr:50S ribosomal protein L2 [Candidatus Omnitrophota bacterium]